jgi:hypothetical protein
MTPPDVRESLAEIVKRLRRERAHQRKVIAIA